MQKSFIELRNRLTFGDVINTYFAFLKQNIKPFLNQYIKYNFISFILMLGCSYLLVTGFMGLASRNFRFGQVSATDETTHTMYLGLGVILLLLVLLFTYGINYSFSSSYITQYVQQKGDFTSKDVWNGIKKNLGSAIVFMLLGVLVYIAYTLLALLMNIIPFVGPFIQYGISFTISAVFGLTFVSMFEKNKGFVDGIGEGLGFTFDNFLLVVGYALVIGLLNLLLSLLVLSIPGFLLFFYAYFSIEDQVAIYESDLAKIIFTVSFSIFIIVFTFSQALGQLAYGVLYYNLHERKHNTFLQSRINQIGVSEKEQ